MPEWEDAETIGGLLRFQSVACGYVGSPLYEDLLARAAEDYERGGPTLRVLAGHEDDPKDSALALRLMGAVHRLVLDGRAPALARRYAAGDGDDERTWEAFRATLEERADELRPLVGRPGADQRGGALRRAASGLPRRRRSAPGMPLRMLEVGASAGLNLRWDRYRYEADGFAWGPPTRRCGSSSSSSARRRMPPIAVDVAERRGCDAAPSTPAARRAG